MITTLRRAIPCERRCSVLRIRRSGARLLKWRMPSSHAVPRPGCGEDRSGSRETPRTAISRIPTGNERVGCVGNRRGRLLLADFRARLVSGELIASGYEVPIRLDSQRLDIPPEKWVKLRFRFGNSSAQWRTLEVCEILVRRAAEPHPERAAAETQQEDPAARTFIQMAEEEMHAMAASGALTGNFKADSHAIADRVAPRFRGRKARSPKTIRNQLNKLYRDLCEQQCAQNDLGDF